MDWTRYRQLERDEWEARKRNPVTVEVTAEMFRDYKFGLLLLRRVQGNTKDGDLLRVEDAVSPLFGRINDAFRAVPEVSALINEQRRLLSEDLIARGHPPLPERNKKEEEAL